MEKLFLLFLFVHVSSPVKHSMTFLITGSSGITNFPELMITIVFDNTVVGSCDTIKKKVEPRHDSMTEFLKKYPQYLQLWKRMCFMRQPNLFKAKINDIKQLNGQTEGDHILQVKGVTEWNNETGGVDNFIKYRYDGEDVLSFDMRTQTWFALKPEAEAIKQSWNADKAGMKSEAIYYTQILPELVQMYAALTKDSQLKKALPSVFLLQQTPSSPVRCFASGFYPKNASLFWRKDGDDLHEDVEHGDILPNHDGTFQMSADLKVSSPEDWRRYECVFQLSGVKDDIVTKLDKTAIRTNWETASNMAAITAAVVVVALVLIAVGIAAGYMIKKKKKDSKPSTKPSADTVQDKDSLEKDSGSSSSTSSTGSRDSSTPLMDNSESDKKQI